VILLLLEPIGAIFDDVCASAHPTAVRFLYHVAYLTITYFSSTTVIGGGYKVSDGISNYGGF
jgi:hypothetical protein